MRMNRRAMLVGAAALGVGCVRRAPDRQPLAESFSSPHWCGWEDGTLEDSEEGCGAS